MSIRAVSKVYAREISVQYHQHICTQRTNDIMHIYYIVYVSFQHNAKHSSLCTCENKSKRGKKSANNFVRFHLFDHGLSQHLLFVCTYIKAKNMQQTGVRERRRKRRESVNASCEMRNTLDAFLNNATVDNIRLVALFSNII